MAVAWRRATLLALAVIAADQLSKALVRATIDRGSRDAVFPAVELVNVRNRGIAFGLLDDSGTLLTVLVLGALAALLVYFMLVAARRPWMWAAVGLLAGGALGNLIDRLRAGAVTDWIDLPLWPAFNLADVAITAGVIALLLALEGPREDAPP